MQRLRQENARLLDSLHSTREELIRCRRDKEDMENIWQRQLTEADTMIQRLHSEITRHIDDKKVAS